MNLKNIIAFLLLLLFSASSIAQKPSITFKNYEKGALEIPDELNLNEYNPYPYDRYLISTDTFGKYKAIPNDSELYQFLLDIDMINMWEWLGKKGNREKEEFFESIPKQNCNAFLQPYRISENFETYLIKIENKSFGGDKTKGYGLECVYLLNVFEHHIKNITLLSVTSKGGFSGHQDYSINLGNHFLLISDDLYSDVIVVDDPRIFDKPRFQKFSFDENGYLKIIN